MCPCPDPRPAARLSLSHCFGYDGDVSRHGHSLQGRNLLLLSLHLDLDQVRGPSDHLLFPAAAVVVLMDTESRRQRCACPTLPCPALLA